MNFKSNVASHTQGKISLRFTTLLLVLLLSATLGGQAQSSYYVNCGNATDGTGTSAAPWNSLTDVNAHVFVPGDSLLFANGATCTGTLSPQGSGSSAAPIVVNQYGSGTALPVIAGAGASNAIYLYNVQYWELNNLEVTNTGASVENRRGIYLNAEDVGTINHLHLTGLYVHDVNGDDTEGLGGSAGIQFNVTGTTTVTQFNDILIQNCIIKNVNREGIKSDSSYILTPAEERPASYTSPWPNGWTNVVIRGNSLSNIGGDGIVPVHSLSPLVEYNIVRGANLHSPGQYNAGIWAFDSNNALIQYNEVSDMGPGGDATGYDEDYDQDHTIIQYNYSHNNAGGFMLSCETCGSPNGTNSIVRYNISINDGNGSPHPMGGLSFYGNTLYLSPATTSTFTRITGQNNIFYEAKAATDSVTCLHSCSNNVLFHVTDLGTDNVTTDPLFFNAGSVPTGLGSLLGYELNAGSPAIGAGTLISGGATTDFFGNSISAINNPNMGAYDGPGGSSANLLTNAGFESGSISPWSVYNSVAVSTANPRSGAYSLLIGPGTSASAQVVSGLASNNTYTFGGWAAVTGTSQTVDIGAKEYDATGNAVAQTLSSSSYTPGYATFTTGASNTTAKGYFYDYSGTGLGYGDDFFFIRDSLSNPGLETGSLSPWSGGSLTTTNQHSGTYGIQVGATPASSLQTITGLSPNTNYVYSGWSKVAVAGDDVVLGVKTFDSTGAQVTQHNTQITYALAQINFTTGPSNTTAQVYCFTYIGTNNGYCDDLAVNLNLLDNPGFESGGLGAWSITGSASVYEGSNARTGNFAMQIVGSSASTQQTVCGLYPNMQYNFSAWANASLSGNSVQLSVSNFNGTSTATSPSITNTTYTPVLVSFTTGSTNTCATVAVTQPTGSSATYVDDLSLALASPQ
jgi:hypothetical protein